MCQLVAIIWLKALFKSASDATPVDLPTISRRFPACEHPFERFERNNLQREILERQKGYKKYSTKPTKVTLGP